MNKPQIVNELINFLESKGHTCTMYNMTKKILEWCHKDECIREKALKNILYGYGNADRLINQGHTCVIILESNPVQIIWCQQENCTKK